MVNNAMAKATQEIRDSLKAEADSLVRIAKAHQAMVEDLRAGKVEASCILTCAAFDDAEPMAALLLRVARLRRAAADASDEFRRELVAAAGKVLRDREDEK
jgi:hypothetical protein